MTDSQDLDTPRSQRQDIFARWHVKHRKTLLVVAVVGLTSLASWVIGLEWFGGVKQYREQDSIAAAPRGVEFRGDTSTIRIRPSTDGRVHLAIRGEYSGATPFMALTTEEDRVLAVVNCYAEPTRKCVLSVDLSMPADLPLEAKTSSGVLDVRGLAGRLQLRTDNGPVNLVDVKNSVLIETLTGQINGTQLSGPRFTVSAREAPIALAIVKKPASVNVSAGSERPVRLTLPADRYRLEVNAGGGTVSTDKRVVPDPSSLSLIRVTTSGGDVALSSPTA